MCNHTRVQAEAWNLGRKGLTHPSVGLVATLGHPMVTIRPCHFYLLTTNPHQFAPAQTFQRKGGCGRLPEGAERPGWVPALKCSVHESYPTSCSSTPMYVASLSTSSQCSHSQVCPGLPRSFLSTQPALPPLLAIKYGSSQDPAH